MALASQLRFVTRWTRKQSPDVEKRIGNRKAEASGGSVDSEGFVSKEMGQPGIPGLIHTAFFFYSGTGPKAFSCRTSGPGGDLAWRGFRSRDILNGMTQLLTDRLAQADNIRVVERTRVYDILDEQDFGQSHRVDAETAAAIGRILGVDFLVLSTLTQLDVGEKGEISFGPLSVSGVTAEVVLSGRVVDATTAEVMGSYRGEGRNTQAALSVSDLKGLSFGSNAFLVRPWARVFRPRWTTSPLTLWPISTAFVPYPGRWRAALLPSWEAN